MSDHDPSATAALDQAGATVRDQLDRLGVNLADPDQRRAVKVTILMALALTPRQLEVVALSLMEDR